MIVPGVAMLIMAFVYYRYTQDTPEGNILDLEKDTAAVVNNSPKPSMREVLTDRRVWILFLIYGCSFGMEITIDNIASLYFIDKFGLSLATAGLLAGLFGAMNIFARALGGIFSDMSNKRYGLKGRSILLGLFVLVEGVGIMAFSQIDILFWSVATMLVFALFLKMGNGATYSVVPYVNKKKLGMVSGIVGAGGNVGAILMGFMFKMEGITYQSGLFIIGIAITAISLTAFFIVPLFEKESVGEVEPAFVRVPVESDVRHH